ncbi:MAG: HD domain-containing protein [Desulfamplus sp.]|nr:HD domain-containing protein [Desulfamplus sp.]
MNKNKNIELTKIVCFSAFKDSFVMDHLEKKETYRLKVCGDPDLLEQTVNEMHPDIILIDCTGNLYQPQNVVESESVIELQNVVGAEFQEITVNDEDNNPSTSDHENQRYFHGKDKNGKDKILEKTPDLLMMPDYLPTHLPLWNIARKSQIIFLFNTDPGMEVRRQCLENKCDIMIVPFLFEELDFKIKLHADNRDLNYRVAWQKATLNRAVEHIDKLKHIILGTREEFSQEKELAYNSLKQINIMSNERVLLKKKLRDLRTNLSDNIKGINEFLCSMVESRNELQKGHYKRVAQISEFVADKTGFEAQSVKVLKNAAMLHEVGMLLIPSSILSKEPSQWSDYEKNMIMLHPSKGAAYLAQCPGFKKVAEIIRHLHENSDGTGFPEGLKKRYIPLSSKILAGADILDQICIDNPHTSVDRLMELLEEHSGTRLDPSIVNLLEKYVVTVLSPQFNNNPVKLKEIAVYQLKPGMVTGTGLFTKTGTKLFSQGTTITEDSIRMLEKYTKEYPVDETVFIKVDLS